jgi:hypothetical protein
VRRHNRNMRNASQKNDHQLDHVDTNNILNLIVHGTLQVINYFC